MTRYGMTITDEELRRMAAERARDEADLADGRAGESCKASEVDYTGRAKKATEDYLRGTTNSDARASAALAAKDDEDGTGSVREGHAFLDEEELKILRKLDSALINKDLYDDYSRVLARVAAQTIDPLPVMERLASTVEYLTHYFDLTEDDHGKNVRKLEYKSLLRDAGEIIAQLKRERGQTEAAEHINKLKKEARDGTV